MKMTRLLVLLSAAPLAVGFKNDNGWKKDDDGNLVTDADGNPIYVDAEGKEQPLAPGYVNRINNEAASARTRAKEAETALEAFDGLDPKAAKEAIDKMKDVNLDELVNKGEIESVRKAVTEAMQGELDKANNALAETRGKLERVTLDNAFNSSNFLSSRLAVPQEAARATFRDRFKVEEDKVIPLDGQGEPLRNKHGEIASVDEAFEMIITGRSDAESWLKAPDASGSGSDGGGGNNGTGNKMKRSDFDALPAGKQAEVGQKAAKGEIEIVD